LSYNQARIIGVGLVLENKIKSNNRYFYTLNGLKLCKNRLIAMHTEKMIEDTINAVQPEQPMTGKISTQQLIEEIGGVKGLEPTRYGDWEKNGRCLDF
jgi:hypothetical protein